ncbi:MAG TPA: aldose epimerase family protein [Opitutaceae bacterium]|nr:aldose epimerase family protein [Opitutaceae bacterium]
MKSRPFGTMPSGEPVTAWTLSNKTGASVEILTLGGIVRTLSVPDRHGRLADVVLGFDTLAAYVARHPYFGAIIGRIAGRVTNGSLLVEGRAYPLARNNGPNHLHGGLVGLDRRVWQAEPVARPDGAASLRLSYHSPDGEEGYPGTVDLAVTYTWTADHVLVIESEATADRPTPISLAHHGYFNLAGEGSGSVADHEVQILADTVIPTDEHFTLLGRRQPVAGQPGDFRVPRRLGDALPSLYQAHGDTYELGAPGGRVVARVTEPRSGRQLTVTTDEAWLQFYTGVALDGTLVGKSGRVYGPHAGLCVECQGYPDATNRPGFGDILVRPGTPQRRRTAYAFTLL